MYTGFTNQPTLRQKEPLTFDGRESCEYTYLFTLVSYNIRKNVGFMNKNIRWGKTQVELKHKYNKEEESFELIYYITWSEREKTRFLENL